MKMHCPHCGVKGSFDESWLGRKVRCPKCTEVFRVPLELESSGLSPVEPGTAEIDLAAPVGMAAMPATGEGADSSDETGGLPEELWSGEEKEPEETLSAHVDGNDDGELIDWSDLEEALDQELDAHPGDSTPRETDFDGAPAALSDPGGLDEFLADSFGRDGLDSRDDGSGRRSDQADIEGYSSVTRIELEDPVPDLPEDAVSEIGEVQEDFSNILREQEASTVEDVPAVPDPLEELTKVLEGMEKDSTAPLASVSNELSINEGDQAITAAPADLPGESSGELPSGNTFDAVPAALSSIEKDEEPAPAADGVPLVPPVVPDVTGADSDAKSESDSKQEPEATPSLPVFDVLREGWARLKGIKGTVWGGSAVMYLLILVLGAAGAFGGIFLGSTLSNSGDTAPILGTVGTVLFQAVLNGASVLFTAGLLLIGIQHVAGEQPSWKTVFAGFSKAGPIIVATILQSILIILGFLLLILPGIYLSVGYAMTVPLIMDRGMSPWQAMETSRKRIHKVWWRICGLLLVVWLIMVVSMIPLGLGIIWTWPLCIVLAGVVYHRLFGPEFDAELESAEK